MGTTVKLFLLWSLPAFVIGIMVGLLFAPRKAADPSPVSTPKEGVMERVGTAPPREPARQELVRREPDAERSFFPDLEGAVDQAVERLRDCLEKLPSVSRKTLEYFYRGGKSVKQIAQKLGKTQSAVKVRLMRARLKLKECLERIEA